MIYQQGDIEVRAARNGNRTIWLSERLVIVYCDGLTEEYLRTRRTVYGKSVPASRREQYIMPDTGESWRFAKINGQFYYDLERIPDRAPARYRSRFGSAERLLEEYNAGLKNGAKESLKDYVERALQQSTGFYPAYSAYPACKVPALAQAAAALQAVVDYITDYGINAREMQPFMDFALVVGELKLTYLPGNYRRLKEKVIRVLGGETATEVITLKREGNSNALKFDDPQLIAWLLVMRSSGMNTTNTMIARRAQLLCALNEKVSPSRSWLEHYLARQDVKQLAVTRYGAGGRLAMRYKGYVPIEGAVYAGDCWQMDGTRMNFIEFTHDGKKWQHLMVVMVMDVHSGAFIGRSYGLAEDRWLYQDALAKAATATGYLPHTIVSDRFPGHNTPEWAELKAKVNRLGTTIDVVHSMTGKAKLERSIGSLQLVAMQQSDKYYGEGIQSRRTYAHRSEEALDSMRKRARQEGWNMARAIEEAEKCFEAYNNTRYCDMSARRTVELTPTALHEQSEKPHAYKASGLEMLHLFGYSKRIQLRNQGMIVTEIQKAKYTYVISAEDWRTMRAHAEVVMYYDLEDLNRVQLFSVADNPVDERFLCEAIEQKAVAWHGPNKDTAAMGKARARIKEIQRQDREDLEAARAMVTDAEEALLGIGGSSKEERESVETAWVLSRSRRDRSAPVHDDDDYEFSANDVRSQY